MLAGGPGFDRQQMPFFLSFFLRDARSIPQLRADPYFGPFVRSHAIMRSVPGELSARRVDLPVCAVPRGSTPRELLFPLVAQLRSMRAGGHAGAAIHRRPP